MHFFYHSIIFAFIFYICDARQECLSVRGHLRCGQQRRFDGDSDIGGSMSGGRGHGSSSGGRGGSNSGSSGWGASQWSSSGGSSNSRSHENPIFIKLIDEDTGGPDDWMDETYASASGAFQVKGCASDGLLGGHIEPMLRIYHKCKGTPKRFTIEIPVEFIDKEYNLTTVFNLQGPLQNEVDDRYPVPECSKRPKFYLFK